ncbi:MAG: zinc ribbon domain-containing protein [Clostridia bacterium]|nr:zinc ribbon domain-containing protein [Clostridia bacterium]
MAKFCTGCGMELTDGLMFCTGCGTKVPEDAPVEAPAVKEEIPAEEKVVKEPVTVQAQPEQQQQYIPPQQQPPPQQTAYTPPPLPREILDSDIKGTKYEPISAWGFIGIMLLMCIPIVGILLVIIWACGGCRKLCKRSLARATLIMTAIGLVISLIIGIAAGGFINFLSKNADADEPGGIVAVFSSITGDKDGEGLMGLLENIEGINKDAEKQNNGWPKKLRKYPGGEAKSVTSYRTEISGTTADEMFSWIEDLKKDGYKFQDFYDMGMTEQDMLDMNGWWATDGKLYLSMSFADGTVTVDHMNELPDLESYFN